MEKNLLARSVRRSRDGRAADPCALFAQGCDRHQM